MLTWVFILSKPKVAKFLRLRFSDFLRNTVPNSSCRNRESHDTTNEIMQLGFIHFVTYFDFCQTFRKNSNVYCHTMQRQIWYWECRFGLFHHLPYSSHPTPTDVFQSLINLHCKQIFKSDENVTCVNKTGLSRGEIFIYHLKALELYC